MLPTRSKLFSCYRQGKKNNMIKFLSLQVYQLPFRQIILKDLYPFYKEDYLNKKESSFLDINEKDVWRTELSTLLLKIWVKKISEKSTLTVCFYSKVFTYSSPSKQHLYLQLTHLETFADCFIYTNFQDLQIFIKRKHYQLSSTSHYCMMVVTHTFANMHIVFHSIFTKISTAIGDKFCQRNYVTAS